MCAGTLAERPDGVRSLRAQMWPEPSEGRDMWDTAESVRFSALLADGDVILAERAFTAGQKDRGRAVGSPWT